MPGCCTASAVVTTREGGAAAKSLYLFLRLPCAASTRSGGHEARGAGTCGGEEAEPVQVGDQTEKGARGKLEASRGRGR